MFRDTNKTVSEIRLESVIDGVKTFSGDFVREQIYLSSKVNRLRFKEQFIKYV